MKTFLLVLCLLSLALTLDPTLEKSYFFVNTNNHLSQELFQTPHGIIAHNVEYHKQSLYITPTYISNYVLINLASKDASPILAKTVSACENTTPTFQHLHYHIYTDSLVYFCSTNSSLLFIDQPSYTVQSAIPLGSSNISWPVASLSTDGNNVVILAMDNLLNQSATQTSALFTINMQTKTISNQILFNQNLAAGENVVAFSTGKKAYYIATNKLQGNNLTTAVYSIRITGNTYQLTPLANLTSYIPFKVVTKLFSLGDFVIVNNGPYLNFINQQGTITNQTKLYIKPITVDSVYELYSPSVTSQGGSTLYLQEATAYVYKYSIIDNAIVLVKNFGPSGEFQIAYGYGNSTAGDLMFALDTPRTWFTVTDLQTSNIVYSAVAGYSDLILTKNTYAIVQGAYYTDYYVYIFDLKTDALINKISIGQDNYFYNKDQQIITYLNISVSSCAIAHIDIATGKVWNTLSFPSSDLICSSWVINARITENGNPEVVFPFTDHYLILTETYAQVIFNASVAPSFNNLNINFDDLSVYYLDQMNVFNISASYYTFNPQSKQFQLSNSNIVTAQVRGGNFFAVNSTANIAFFPLTITLINEVSQSWSKVIQQTYNFASSFSDSDGKQNIIVASKNLVGIYSTFPSIISDEGVRVSLPGTRDDTNSAQATGVNSYAVYDDISQAFGLVRFYNADPVSSQAKKTLISI